MKTGDLSVVAVISLLACSESCLPTNNKALEVWRHNEDMVEGVLAGEAELDDEFMEACDFFRSTIGIVIRFDADPNGLIVTRKSREDFEVIRKWFKDNSHRLYWDGPTNSVKVRPPAGLAGAIWWRHESTLIDAVAGRPLADGEANEARNFFLDLTGIDVFQSRDLRASLVPSKGSQTILPRLRAWYEKNGPKLFVEPSSGSITTRRIPG